MRNAFKIMPVKTDRKDARGIAELIGLAWFWPVHCKSPGDPRHTDRAQAGAEGLPEAESSLRGILRGFGLKVGKTTPVHFERRTKELVAGHPSLEIVASALLSVRATLRCELGGFEKRPRGKTPRNRGQRANADISRLKVHRGGESAISHCATTISRSFAERPDADRV